MDRAGYRTDVVRGLCGRTAWDEGLFVKLFGRLDGTEMGFLLNLGFDLANPCQALRELDLLPPDAIFHYKPSSS